MTGGTPVCHRLGEGPMTLRRGLAAFSWVHWDTGQGSGAGLSALVAVAEGVAGAAAAAAGAEAEAEAEAEAPRWPAIHPRDSARRSARGRAASSAAREGTRGRTEMPYGESGVGDAAAARAWA